MQKAAFDIFTTSTYQKYIDRIVDLVGNDQLKDVLDGFCTIPKPLGADGFEIKMWKNEGSFKTPGFKEPYDESYHSESKEYHVALDFPEGLAEQVGNGSLIVEIEVDTRQVDGWVEKVEYSEGRKFFLVRETKEWAEAEAHCQSRGAHLASVLTEEELLEVKTLIDDSFNYYVWLGGYRIGDIWSWSDGSTWNFTNWIRAGESTQQGTDQCLLMDEKGGWTTDSCTSGDYLDLFSSVDYPFACKAFHQTLERTTKMRYTGDQLVNIPSLHVRYTYQAASQQLLDSWEEKRTTGFRLSWRIEGANGPHLELTTDEVGSTIETPGFQSDEFEERNLQRNHSFSATLVFPEDLADRVGNGFLVIELEVETRQEEGWEEYVEYRGSKDFKLYEPLIYASTWKVAKENCEVDGRQLASFSFECERTR